MIYLFLSSLMTISMVLLFKWFEQHRIDLFQAIVVNYYACLLTGFALAPANTLNNLNDVWQAPWLIGALLIGILFITCFPLIGKSVQCNGAAVTSIAGRTSMVLPVAAAVWLYGDTLPVNKVIGIILAIIAVYLTTVKPASSDVQTPISSQKPQPILPLLIFLMSGIIEISFNYSQKKWLPDDRSNILFTMALFLVAGLIGLLILSIKLLRRQTTIRWQNIAGGIALGIPNYLSVYFFLLALTKSGWQSSVVIPVINISIVLGTCLGAWWFFSEKLSPLNAIGVLLASAAIVLIAY